MIPNVPSRIALPSILVVMCSLSACSPESGKSAQAAAESPISSPKGSSGALPGSQVASGRFVGQVVETMDAGSYTYVALARDGEQVWAAGPRKEVAVGDEIAIALGMRMDGFHSDTLDRTFDAIYFVGELEAPGSAPGGAAAGTADPHAGVQQRMRSEDVAAEIDPGSIHKPEGAYRIADLWKGREGLAGKEVVVRGRVVKYNAGILGRNWMHLQDGTGESGSGDHDITVTSTQSAEVGDVVTVRGVVALDRDFGAGYRYDLIVEEATVEADL